MCDKCGASTSVEYGLHFSGRVVDAGIPTGWFMLEHKHGHYVYCDKHDFRVSRVIGVNRGTR
jgi:hypothetical protein